MNKVSTTEVQLSSYAGLASEELLDEITAKADRLRGLHIVHANATPVGGGVAEILKSLVPLMRGIGINADWFTIEPDETFFRVSKQLHHCLQGDSTVLNSDEVDIYLTCNEKSAQALTAMGVKAHLWIIHDVQLLPILHYLQTSSPGVWVCHVDATAPNNSIMEFLLPYMKEYQQIVASMPEYKPAGSDSSSVTVFPPAIDPLSPKNQPLPRHEARKALAKLGIDPVKPLVSQVSRFDRWKDPWGVVDAYRLAKKEIPALQLALVGVMTAKDDADAFEVLASVQSYVDNDPDIHIYSNPLVVGDLEVNAFQSGSDVIIQKSIREGFGLTVAEAMLKATPVIGGNCGGIKLQIHDGITGYLVDDALSCASRIITLINDGTSARRIGSSGQALVRRKYLMPRLLRDYLSLSLSLIDDTGPLIKTA